MMVEKRLWLVVIVIIAVFSPARVRCSYTTCPANSQLFLSINRDLLPTSNVRATSEDTLFNPVSDFITHNTELNPPWCSETDITTISGHYVELNFTEPVVVTLLESSGFFNGYVNNFEIEYGMPRGELQTYTVNEVVQQFLVNDILLANAYFTLEQPIVAQRFRFKIKDAVLDPTQRICWELLMYGCKQSDGIRVQLEPQQITTPTDPSPTPTQEPATGCPPAGTDGLKGSSIEEVLVVILPIALATIVVVIVIAIVSVLICLSCSARGSKKTNDSNYETVTVHMLNNKTKELTGVADTETRKSSISSSHYDSPRFLSYDVPRVSTRSQPASEGGSSDMLSGTFEIKNPLYSLKRSYSKPDTPEVFVPDPDGGNDYEMIPGPLSPDPACSTRHASLPPTGKERSPDPPPSLPLRTHTYSLVRKKKAMSPLPMKTTSQRSFHASTSDIGRKESKERINESIYNKLSKVAGSDPMFQVVYDEPCNEDADIDCSVV